MKNRLIAYFMTVVAVACFFRAAPDLEATHFPIVIDQSVSEVKRADITPVVINQSISNVTRTNDSVCFTWKFTKHRDIPLSMMIFPITDTQGNIYDSETKDMDRNDVVKINPEKAINPVGEPQERHYCTSLPYTNEDLTVRGMLVYKTLFNLWPVTHFTPTIVVPKD